MSTLLTAAPHTRETRSLKFTGLTPGTTGCRSTARPSAPLQGRLRGPSQRGCPCGKQLMSNRRSLEHEKGSGGEAGAERLGPRTITSPSRQWITRSSFLALGTKI